MVSDKIGHNSISLSFILIPFIIVWGKLKSLVHKKSALIGGGTGTAYLLYWLHSFRGKQKSNIKNEHPPEVEKTLVHARKPEQPAPKLEDQKDAKIAILKEEVNMLKNKLNWCESEMRRLADKTNALPIADSRIPKASPKPDKHSSESQVNPWKTHIPLRHPGERKGFIRQPIHAAKGAHNKKKDIHRHPNARYARNSNVYGTRSVEWGQAIPYSMHLGAIQHTHYPVSSMYGYHNKSPYFYPRGCNSHHLYGRDQQRGGYIPPLPQRHMPPIARKRHIAPSSEPSRYEHRRIQNPNPRESSGGPVQRQGENREGLPLQRKLFDNCGNQAGKTGQESRDQPSEGNLPIPFRNACRKSTMDNPTREQPGQPSPSSDQRSIRRDSDPQTQPSSVDKGSQSQNERTPPFRPPERQKNGFRAAKPPIPNDGAWVVNKRLDMSEGCCERNIVISKEGPCTQLTKVQKPQTLQVRQEPGKINNPYASEGRQKSSIEGQKPDSRRKGNQITVKRVVRVKTKMGPENMRTAKSSRPPTVNKRRAPPSTEIDAVGKGPNRNRSRPNPINKNRSRRGTNSSSPREVVNQQPADKSKFNPYMSKSSTSSQSGKSSLSEQKIMKGLIMGPYDPTKEIVREEKKVGAKNKKKSMRGRGRGGGRGGSRGRGRVAGRAVGRGVSRGKGNVRGGREWITTNVKS